MLPEDQDVPYRYAPAPTAFTDTLLSTYDSAVKTSHDAVTALDILASAANSPPDVLTTLRAASRQPTPYLHNKDTIPAWHLDRQQPADRHRTYQPPATGSPRR